jgi:hypothetical protein
MDIWVNIPNSISKAHQVKVEGQRSQVWMKFEVVRKEYCPKVLKITTVVKKSIHSGNTDEIFEFIRRKRTDWVICNLSAALDWFWAIFKLSGENFQTMKSEIVCEKLARKLPILLHQQVSDYLVVLIFNRWARDNRQKRTEGSFCQFWSYLHPVG